MANKGVCECTGEMVLLLHWSMLNYTAVVKILKKHGESHLHRWLHACISVGRCARRSAHPLGVSCVCRQAVWCGAACALSGNRAEAGEGFMQSDVEQRAQG